MNWVLTAIGSIIGTIILSVLGNILTEPFKGWLAKTSLRSRKNRIGELNNELEGIRKYSKDNAKLIAESITQILALCIFFITELFLGLLSASCAVILFLGREIYEKVFLDGLLNIGFFALALFLVLIPTSIAYAFTIIRFMMKIKNFDQYEINIQAKIASLQNIANSSK
jgi:hypothetical protein